MKRIVSLLLAGVMMVSAVPVTYAADTQDHSLGTQVVFTAANNENYTITVPASLNPGQSGTVTLDGYWPDSKTVTVTAEKTVTLKNSIKAADTKTLNVTFLGISEAGSNTSKQTFTEPVSVEGISNALFGTWSGKFNYNVDSVEEEVVPPSENYIGTVSSDNTITLSGVESAGTYTLRYANANGALENYADICSLEVTDPATAVSYDDLIAENCAPVEATSIAVYNAADEKVGDIALGGLKTNLGTKLYSFGAISDVHIGYDNAGDYLQAALSFFEENENISFIGICGDLTADCSDVNLNTYKNIIDSHANVPVYAITGNHDTEQYRGSNITESIQQFTGQSMYYSITQGNDVFIFLGTHNGYETGRIFTREQLQWFYETLEANKDKRCFVFEHILPDGTSGNPSNLQAAPMWGGTETVIFEDLLEHYSNVTMFHGHSHTAFELQSISDIANYDNFLGRHSIHIPALFGTRELKDGSRYEDFAACEGYVVDVYENSIVLRGLDFQAEEFYPIAQYHLDTTLQTVDANTYVDETNTINCDTVIPVWNDNTTIGGNNASLSAHDDYSASEIITLSNNKTYYVHQYWNCPYPAHAYYYDSNGIYISRELLWSNTEGTYYSGPVELTIPAGTAYMRLRIFGGEKETQEIFVTSKDSAENENSYTNVLETVGYIADKRLSGSTGEEKDNPGSYITGFIPFTPGDTVYLKNVTMPIDAGNPDNMICLYYADKTYKTGYPLLSSYDFVYAGEDGNVIGFTTAISDIAYVRIGAKHIDDTSIITVNEPIN